jgi:hypothetical protein
MAQKKTVFYNLEYWAGKKKIEVVARNMTKGFCGAEKKRRVDSGRFSIGKFKLRKV